MRLADLSATIVGGMSRMGAMPPTLGFGIGLAVQNAVAHVARNPGRKGRRAVDVVLILALIGVVLWATGHLVLH